MRPSSISSIFLVGCPRSGTTWLQSLLAAHPEIASLPESKFFQYAVPNQRDPKPDYQSRRYKLGMISTILKPRLIEFFQYEINRPDLLQYFPKIPLMRLYSLQFIKIMNIIAEEQNKRIWLDKTPEHLYFLKDIEKFVPKAKIIHIIRNGSDVVASLYEVTHKYPDSWDGAWDIDRCIDRWKQSIDVSRCYFQKENHIMVRYEQLVANPPEILKKICTFIGVEFNETMLTEYNNAAQKLVFEAGGRTVKPVIQNCNSKKFYEVFNEQQQQYVLERLSQVNLDTLNSV